MALQMMIGIKKGNELIIPENQKNIYYTNTLSKLCNSFLQKRSFYEDEEKVIYQTLNMDALQKICGQVENIQNDLVLQAKKTKGYEEKNEIIEELHDYLLFWSIAYKVFNKANNCEDVYIVLL